MVNLEKIREVMVQQLEEDQSRVFVETSAKSLEDALSNAAIQLGISVRDIDYEVLQRGSSSFLSLNKRDWSIRAYEIKKTKKKASKGEVQEEILESAEPAFVQEDRNGEAFVFCASDGVYVKVVPPLGNGAEATIRDIQDKLRDRNITTISEEILRPLVKSPKSEYIKVGMYRHTPGNDAMMAVDITDQEMKAFL